MYPETMLVRQNYGQDNHLFHSQVWQKLKEVFYTFSHQLKIESQIIYQYHKALDKYKGSHILILGGGPSTNRIDWTLLDYDYVWSMNHCFFNEMIFDLGVDFLTIGCSVDINDPIFLDFIRNHSPLLGFELHVKYYKASERRQLNIQEANDLEAEKICYQTKWYSQLGTGARQLIFASYLQPSTISFIGFDGPAAIYAHEHAFLGNDNHSWESQHMLPGTIRHLPQEAVYNQYWIEYQAFWEFIKTHFPSVKYNSIDRENQYHAAIL